MALDYCNTVYHSMEMLLIMSYSMTSLVVNCPCISVADNYVHRLVQNKADGKLVEVSGQSGMVSSVWYLATHLYTMFFFLYFFTLCAG